MNEEENDEKKLGFAAPTKKNINESNDAIKVSKDQIKTTNQAKPQNLTKDIKIDQVLSLEDLINLCSKKKEVHLKYDLENNVNLIKFAEGKIDISFNEKLDKKFVRNLSERLVQWTGIRWVITLARKEGQKTFAEIQSIKKVDLINEEKKKEIYKKFKDVFDDGELLKVEKKD